ncbi:MAG: hypothetical protein QME81_03885 [bacterium]|nr:hypothetical protein [bacterium]
MIKKICGPSYRPVVPDPEYPQDKLLGKSVGELTELLTRLAQTRKRYKLNCIVKSLISDMEELQTWIKSLSPQDVALFRETVVESGIHIPPEAWELLGGI